MEDLVEELLKNHQKDKDLTGPNVQQEVKKLRKKYNRVETDLGDDEQLVGLDWSWASLDGYCFKGLKISKRKKRANFKKANLMKTNLKNADLTGVYFDEALLSGASIEKEILLGGSLKKTTLIGANLSWGDLRLANLQNADISHANLKNTNFLMANLNNANLVVSNMEKAEFQRADLENADLTATIMRGVDLSFANLRGAKLMFAHLEGANLESTDLREADLTYSFLIYTNLNGCRLHDSNIEYTYLTDDIHEIKEKEIKDIPQKLSKDNIYLKSIDLIKNRIESTFDDKSRYKKAADIYRNIKNTLHQNGAYDAESKYHLKEQRAITKHYRKSLNFKNWIINSVFRLLCGYGEKPLWVIPWVIFVIMCFGTLFWGFNGIQQDLSVALHPLDNYYFSVVTFTTLGFGDLYPNSVRGLLNIPWFRVVAALEAFIGAFLMALFVVVAAKRIMR